MNVRGPEHEEAEGLRRQRRQRRFFDFDESGSASSEGLSAQSFDDQEWP